MSKSGLFLGLMILMSLLLAGQGICAQLKSADIGDAAEKPGTTEMAAGGIFTIVGAGHDIWDAADGFRYVYTQVSGNFEADVQIASFQRVTEWAKAGLMARQSVDAGSKNALSTAAAGKGPGQLGVQLTYRVDNAGETKELNYWELGGQKGFNDGEWIRLKRAGDSFSASWSKDGITWAKDYATITIKMTDPILLGMVVTSCDKALTCKATFQKMTVNGTNIATAVNSSGKLARAWGDVKSGY